MRKIDIFDTTLRDGEQSAGVNLHFNEKVEIAYQLERYGVNILEAGYPASSEGDFRAVQYIARTIKGCSVTGLARSVQSDIDAAWEALKDGVDPRLHVFIATSPIHMQYKLKMSEEELIETAVSAVKYAKRFFPKVQWSAEDATRSDWDFLVEIITKVIDAGACVINLPDTVGYMHPEEYGSLFRYIREHVPNIDRVKLSAHCHDDLGMAVANSLAAIENGVEQIEGTINGIGERAGNAALEEIGVALYTRRDHYQAETSLDLSQTIRTSQLVSKLTGMPVPPNKAVVGANAFAHESGIHQDGVLKNKLTYEIIEPELVGLSSNRMVLGKHSGRHAFREKCKEMGLQLSEEAFQNLFKAFKDLTAKKKEVTEDDILTLLMNTNVQAKEERYELQFLQVAYGSTVVPTTTVGIKLPSGEVVQESATGKGSVESLYNAIQRVLDSEVKLLDYRIQSTTSGIDSLAEVYVKVNYHGQTSSGRGIEHDVLEASAKAYLDAVNRILFKEQYMQVQNKQSEEIKGVKAL
ncbi:2-isopropylmalate synthase [Caldalkalibacillus thermarum]|uniref:2-isopropylmalate synthase n=1 Tax=Caldalkalibacillus thermarum TaxID=296745 RepID=UPI00166C445A|nr:2-isopropylmalate synthase [Caldalkalibacillus thermarum]GGK11714.1 2-isopropylmalate synthase [Caldalkalibacillus thermarum]